MEKINVGIIGCYCSPSTLYNRPDGEPFPLSGRQLAAGNRWLVARQAPDISIVPTNRVVGQSYVMTLKGHLSGQRESILQHSARCAAAKP